MVQLFVDISQMPSMLSKPALLLLIVTMGAALQE